MGLLDSRPAIDAYTVRGAMQSSEDTQESLDLNEAEIVAASHHLEDDDVTVGPRHPEEGAPLHPEENGPEATSEPEPQPEETDHSIYGGRQRAGRPMGAHPAERGRCRFPGTVRRSKQLIRAD